MLCLAAPSPSLSVHRKEGGALITASLLPRVPPCTKCYLQVLKKAWIDCHSKCGHGSGSGLCWLGLGVAMEVMRVKIINYAILLELLFIKMSIHCNLKSSH